MEQQEPDLYLCTLDEYRQMRCEFTISLVFVLREKVFRIRTVQDYETQAKAPKTYQTVQEYLSQHPDKREQIKDAIQNYEPEKPEHAKLMKAAARQTDL